MNSLVERAELLFPGITLTEKQKEFIVNPFLSSNDFWDRRTGASTALTLSSVLFAQDFPNQRQLIFAPIQTMSEMLKRNFTHLSYSKEFKIKKITTSPSRITFTNGATIDFTSLNSQSYSGRSYNRILVDGVQESNESLFQAIGDINVAKIIIATDEITENSFLNIS